MQQILFSQSNVANDGTSPCTEATDFCRATSTKMWPATRPRAGCSSKRMALPLPLGLGWQMEARSGHAP